MSLRPLRRLAALTLLGAVLAPATASAQPAGAGSSQLSPEQLVRKVTADVMTAIQSDAELRAGDRKKAIALAEEKVLPLIDFHAMTRLAVGRAWARATPAQRDALAGEFRTLLVGTYANAIDAYKGQTMRVLPVKAPADATEVTVRNLYLKPGKSPLPVDYDMVKTPDGWKIVDIVVDGVSLVLTYRSEFVEVASRDGIEGLIRQLREKNKANAARLSS